MLEIHEIFSVPSMQWSQVSWLVLAGLLLTVLTFQTLLNIYTEKKLDYFLPTRTNVISYILSTAFVLAGYIHLGEVTINFMLVAFAVMILSSTALIDVHYQELPNEYNYALTLLSLLYLGLNVDQYENILIGGIASFLLYLVMAALSAGVGGGDVKMSFAIGAFIGGHSLLVWLMLTFFTGAIVAIGLLVFKKKSLKYKFAFGPFMAFSGIYLMLFFI